MRATIRVALVVALALVLGVMLVHHESGFDDAWPHPDGDQLEASIDAWDGEDILVIEEVEDTAGDVLEVAVENEDEEVVMELTVEDAAVDVEPGGTVQVYGKLDVDGGTMAAENVVVVNRDRSDHHYKLAMSGAGLLVAMGFFLRQWRIDLRGLCLRKRGGDQVG